MFYNTKNGVVWPFLLSLLLHFLSGNSIGPKCCHTLLKICNWRRNLHTLYFTYFYSAISRGSFEILLHWAYKLCNIYVWKFFGKYNQSTFSVCRELNNLVYICILCYPEVETLQEAKKEAVARKKRQKTAVVGDMKPLEDTLPTLELLLKESSKQPQRSVGQDNSRITTYSIMFGE